MKRKPNKTTYKTAFTSSTCVFLRWYNPGQVQRVCSQLLNWLKSTPNGHSLNFQSNVAS